MDIIHTAKINLQLSVLLAIAIGQNIALFPLTEETNAFSPYYFPGGGRIGTTGSGDLAIRIGGPKQIDIIPIYRFKINHKKEIQSLLVSSNSQCISDWTSTVSF